MMNPSRAVAEAYRVYGDLAVRERSEEYRMKLTVDFIERQSGGYAGKRVLDLGSSLGIQLFAAKELGASQVVGVDKFIFPDAFENDFSLSSRELDALKSIWSQKDIQVQRQDLEERLLFQDNSFDIVVCNAVIEHLHGVHKQLFQEVCRVLAPGGTFVFTTPNLTSLLKRVRFVVGRSPMWDLKDYLDSGKEFTGHVREFTIPECRTMLTSVGLSDVRVTSRPSYIRWGWIRNPKKAHQLFFQGMSTLWPSWGDLIFAAGKKPRG